jgi:glycosyltransferase involved in cell wall biosynthesis
MIDHPYAWKGTQEGVDMVLNLKKQIPNVQLVLLSAKKTATDLLCDEFHSNPRQEDLKRIYSSCDVFLCPSWDEGSGLPSMEAMLCGLALVTYDNGGSRDYAVDGETALVAPQRDSAALSEQLRRMIMDVNLRKTLAAAGRSKILAMPTWEEQSKRFERILSELCQ